MKPVLTEGNWAIVELGVPVNVGDIILYRIDDGDGIVHRIIEINGNSIVCKGDNNNYPDNPIDISSVIGRVKVVIY